MPVNEILPTSHKMLLDKYEGLKQDREGYSGLHDSIMDAIHSNLIEHKGKEEGERIWQCGLFPERLTKQVLRLVEEYNDSKSEL